MARLLTVHPFADGNGRTARLLARRLRRLAVRPRPLPPGAGPRPTDDEGRPQPPPPPPRRPGTPPFPGGPRRTLDPGALDRHRVQTCPL
ncbi:Fic family protein [Streptomyces sp. NBC_00691]|uniref:Fic family protein n=1 Tax=Streptomyces sp. NBC_00691 TaxID=2903671 RepID=UPI003FA6CF89